MDQWIPFSQKEKKKFWKDKNGKRTVHTYLGVSDFSSSWRHLFCFSSKHKTAVRNHHPSFRQKRNHATHLTSITIFSRCLWVIGFLNLFFNHIMEGGMFNPTLPLDTFQNLRNFEMTHHEESSSSSSSHLFYFLRGWHLQPINLLEKMPLAAWNPMQYPRFCALGSLDQVVHSSNFRGGPLIRRFGKRLKFETFLLMSFWSCKVGTKFGNVWKERHCVWWLNMRGHFCCKKPMSKWCFIATISMHLSPLFVLWVCLCSSSSYMT